MPSFTILHGGAVLTDEGLLQGWGVRLLGTRIDKVAPNAELVPSGSDTLIDATAQIITPGFVNGHMHMYGALSHGITVHVPFTDFSGFLKEYWWPWVEDRIDHKLAALTAQWCCVEMIESGITSFFDILEAPNGLPGILEAEAQVIQAAGLRAMLSFEASERMGQEISLLGIKENENFIKSMAGNDLIQGVMSTHTLFSCSKPFIQQARAAARDLGAKFHMHLNESVYEPNWSLDMYEKRPVEVYEELGCLDEDVIASQAVQLDGREISIMNGHDVAAIHMPLSNCEVGGGVAPVGEMLDAGMRVGLGTDGYINNFFEVMRGAFLIHKAHKQDPQVMPAERVYKMATALGASALGLQEVGSIREGYLADIITVRMDDIPTPINPKNVYDQIILYRNPQDVVHVFVNGKQLKKDGQLTTLDKAAIREELRRESEKFWQMDGR